MVYKIYCRIYTYAKERLNLRALSIDRERIVTTLDALFSYLSVDEMSIIRHQLRGSSYVDLYAVKRRKMDRGTDPRDYFKFSKLTFILRLDSIHTIITHILNFDFYKLTNFRQGSFEDVRSHVMQLWPGVADFQEPKSIGISGVL